MSKNRKVKLRSKGWKICCSCNGGKISFDATGKEPVNWEGDCQNCDRLNKCVEAIRSLRNEMCDHSQK